VRASEQVFDAFMFPLERMTLRRRRRRRLPAVAGRVLETGAGTGANLDHYDLRRVSELHLSDISLSGSLRRRAAVADGIARFHEADVQHLPFEDSSFDWVVSTLLFCSVPDPALGLSEVWRVLRPHGKFLFIEHVRPEGRILGAAVDRFNPAWRSFNGECNINRDTLSEIRRAGFEILELHSSGRGLLVDGGRAQILRESVTQRLTKLVSIGNSSFHHNTVVANLQEAVMATRNILAEVYGDGFVNAGPGGCPPVADS
jgi:ubiquinone/menaquinone biosynthesis C-methylase UbiE